MKEALIKYGIPAVCAALGALGAVGTQKAIAPTPIKTETQIIQIKPDCPRIPDIYLDNVKLERKK